MAWLNGYLIAAGFLLVLLLPLGLLSLVGALPEKPQHDKPQGGFIDSVLSAIFSSDLGVVTFFLYFVAIHFVILGSWTGYFTRRVPDGSLTVMNAMVALLGAAYLVCLVWGVRQVLLNW